MTKTTTKTTTAPLPSKGIKAKKQEKQKGIDVMVISTDVYTRVTEKIIAELEKGERPWLKPWNAEHAAGKITRPLRHNGLPYSGINVLMLWVDALEKGA